MSITVGAIYSKFPSFKPEDMIDLVGTENFNGRTQISLSRIASYQGGYAKDLGIFVAQKEGKNYTNLLSETKREQVSDATGVVIQNNNTGAGHTVNNKKIPMNVSIFNIPRENMA